MHISIDFDRTIVSDAFPLIGKLQHGAKQTINKWYNEGHTIIISTCRTGDMEMAVKDFLDTSGIKYHYINENSSERISMYGTDTRKISCDINFDDRNAGGFMGWWQADLMVNEMAYRKPLIICIIGESGSGKTTLADYIEENYAIPSIKSYTDRPRRTQDEQGHTFLTKEEYTNLVGNKIAFCEFGGYRYCSLEQDVREENVYVIEEGGYLLLLANYRDKYRIKSIRVKCDEVIRRMRVGQDRVNRDKGKFTLEDKYFNFVINTTNSEIGDYPLLEEKILQWTNRGWYSNDEYGK